MYIYIYIYIYTYLSHQCLAGQGDGLIICIRSGRPTHGIFMEKICHFASSVRRGYVFETHPPRPILQQLRYPVEMEVGGCFVHSWYLSPACSACQHCCPDCCSAEVNQPLNYPIFEGQLWGVTSCGSRRVGLGQYKVVLPPGRLMAKIRTSRERMRRFVPTWRGVFWLSATQRVLLYIVTLEQKRDRVVVTPRYPGGMLHHRVMR